MTPRPEPWAVVVPVKRLDSAKTRLGLTAAARADLALAMAVDTVSACLATEGVALVVVVTDDRRAKAVMEEQGAVVVPDEPDAGLNPALVHGATVADARLRGARIATVSSDLPALRPADLAAVLTAAGRATRAVVADADGSGTTALIAAGLAHFVPHFGLRSLAAHTDAGAVDLTVLAPPSLRRDVDTVDDLRLALGLGCGPATVAAAHAHRVATLS